MEGCVIRSARRTDLTSVEHLLASASLPVAGVAEHFGTFVVAEDETAIIGAAGLELYPGGCAILRSLIVDPRYRGRGVGLALVREAIDQPAAGRLNTVYLLTTTAADFFTRLGFTAVSIDAVPTAMKRSVLFTGACPSAAAIMSGRASTLRPRG